MRLLLDTHISGPRVGTGLARLGHDVRAVDGEKELEGVSDEKLFELAVSEGRILVSQNAKDFSPIVGRHAPGRSHPGLILIPYTIRLGDFGGITTKLQEMIENTTQEHWVDRVEWMKKGQ